MTPGLRVEVEIDLAGHPLVVEFGLNARAHARDHHGRQARQGELAIAGEGPRPKTYLLGQRGVEQKVSELGQQRLVVEYSSSYCLFINDLTNAILPVSHRVHKGYKLKLRALGGDIAASLKDRNTLPLLKIIMTSGNLVNTDHN
jgi:hypothetical protein